MPEKILAIKIRSKDWKLTDFQSDLSCMVLAPISLNEDYWETFELNDEDIEILYNHLLEKETPLSTDELVSILVENRLEREQQSAEDKKAGDVKSYLPEDSYTVGEKIVFSSLDWETGKVINIRQGNTALDAPFKVIEVEFEGGQKREFAAELSDHKLNIPLEIDEDDPLLNPSAIASVHGDYIIDRVADSFSQNEDFVFIAGRWFPRPLLLDVSAGILNLADAVLDMSEGGPLPTAELLKQVDMPSGDNEKLAEFSLDLALQEDERFDEVGTSGEVSWFLKRQEPKDVLETPIFLKYKPIEYDNSVLTDEMRSMVHRLQDELSPREDIEEDVNKYETNLLFPHWRAGTLPLTPNLSKLFPSAYISPRVRFILVDGDTGEKFPGWVVRLEGYVYGLKDWYTSRGVMPGCIIRLREGENLGEVIVEVDSHRSAKEWVRTALVGADGGVVYAMLKQTVRTAFDDWMMIAIPADTASLDEAWEKSSANPPAFEQVVVNTLRELAKLNPQGHVHAAELYSAVNLVFRCPPEPLLALLASRSWFKHLGDLHYRFEETEV